MNETKHLHIHGLVQGVGYRAAMLRQAQTLGVNGWVRNRSDGSVEALVQGAATAVAAMIAWAQHGPRAARVERVAVSAGEGVYREFSALPTL